eukprot:scaffold309_cov235-Pinguiococcus_pyrenoidosus.AAC.18
MLRANLLQKWALPPFQDSPHDEDQQIEADRSREADLIRTETAVVSFWIERFDDLRADCRFSESRGEESLHLLRYCIMVCPKRLQ